MGRSRDRPSFLDSRYRPFSGKNGTVADFSSAPRKPWCKETVSIIASPPDAPRKKNARKFHPTLRDGHRRPSRTLGRTRACGSKARRHKFVRLSPCFRTHWSCCRLKDAMNVNNSSCCGVGAVPKGFSICTLRKTFTRSEDFLPTSAGRHLGGEPVCVSTTVPPGRISCSPKQRNSARARNPALRSMAPAAAFLIRGCADEASQNGLRHHHSALGTCRRVRRRPVQRVAHRNRNAGPGLDQSARCRAAT